MASQTCSGLMRHTNDTRWPWTSSWRTYLLAFPFYFTPTKLQTEAHDEPHGHRSYIWTQHPENEQAVPCREVYCGPQDSRGENPHGGISMAASRNMTPPEGSRSSLLAVYSIAVPCPVVSGGGGGHDYKLLFTLYCLCLSPLFSCSHLSPLLALFLHILTHSLFLSLSLPPCRECWSCCLHPLICVLKLPRLPVETGDDRSVCFCPNPSCD